MNYKSCLLLCHVICLVILSTQALKIGISKHLPLTTTMEPNTTLMETTTEEINTEIYSSTVASTTPKITTTTPKPTTAESEWPEFPPKKSSKSPQKTTTKKPITTNTVKPSTTTSNEVTKETNVTDKPEFVTPTSPPKRPIQQKYCFCDLSKDLCDINCCCDPDCVPEALKVFHCQLEKPIDLEVHEGRFEDFKFQHGLPSCEINDGWLCVFRTYKPVIQEEITHSFEDTSRYNKWPNLLLESEEIKSREFYKFGDILRIVNMETKEIQNFDLPSSFQSPSCQIHEPIYHLKPIKRTCFISSYENLKESLHKLQKLHEKYKIFIKPNIPEDLYNNKYLKNHIGNITLNQCFQNQQNCSKYKPNKEEQEIEELFKIKINILHNFTNIHQIVINLWLKGLEDKGYEDKSKKDLWLSYEVEFLNNTLHEFNANSLKDIKKSTIVSGPLGYLPGKPIIIGRYEAFNKTLPSSSKNQVLNYFSTNNSESHTLSLFSKENGECKRFEPAKDFIQYGINVAKYCKIKMENDTELWEDASKTNFTKICLNLQQRIHGQLFGQDLMIADLSSYLVSALGKPENNTNKWLQLQVFNSDFDTVVGQYLHETNTFVCRNILLSLTYEFYMAIFMVDNIPLQNMIKHAALHLAERHDLEFALDENLEVPITMTVRFYDVHEKAVSAAYKLKYFNLVFGLIWGLTLILII